MLGGVDDGNNWLQDEECWRRNGTLLALVWRRAFTLGAVKFWVITLQQFKSCEGAWNY